MMRHTIFFLLSLLMVPLTARADNIPNSFPKITTQHKMLTSSENKHFFIEITSVNTKPWSVADLGGYSQITIKDNESNIIGTLKFNTPIVEMKIYHFNNFPEPLIVFSTTDRRGASEDFGSIYPYSIIDNKIKLLQTNKKKWKFDTYAGGFYIGKLPSENNIGAVFWTYVWDMSSKDESHMGPHRYSVEIYRWNGQEFILSKTLLTKNKFFESDKALHSTGINVQDMSADFSNIQAVR